MAGHGHKDLSVQKIVDAAVALLDNEGLAAFSMRALGAKLGCSATALYRHIGSREALLRLVVARTEAAPPEMDDGPWYERLERLVREEWAYTWPDHPWLVEIWQRGLLDPRTSRRLEVTLQVYRDAGFDSALERALLAHWSFIVGTLGLVRAMHTTSDHMFEATDDEIFEYNLGIFLAGIRAEAGSADGATRRSRER